MNIGQIFSPENRGRLLDVFVFLMNLFLMYWLARSFTEIVREASGGDLFAEFMLLLFALGLFVLPVLGAILKRWHFHQRIESKEKNATFKKNVLRGCLFNPIFYFVLNVLIFATVETFAMSLLFGSSEPGEAVFVSTGFLGVFFVIFQTYWVYRYFAPPKSAPKSAFLRDPRAGLLGDLCIFLNVLCFQLLWNLILMIPMERPPNLPIPAEIVFRFFLIGFAALLIYFPPRIFYLAEDIDRPVTWLTILLAISPVAVRFILAGI